MHAPNDPLSTKTVPVRSFISRSRRKHGLFFCALALLACFALPPAARAVTPAPDGGYPLGNTAEGEDALFSLTTGVENTANGSNALFSNTTGDANTATGRAALYSNTTGALNTATGNNALLNNTTGNANTANGDGALYSNTTADGNTATGYQVLYSNTTGFDNTAIGFQSLYVNTDGVGNTATGTYALLNNAGGLYNTATGNQALISNVAGSENVATGSGTLGSNLNGSYNTAYGGEGLGATTGSSNIAIGFQAGVNLTSGNNNIDVGNAGVAGESGRIRIGTSGTQTKTFIAGIKGAGVNGSAVKINAAGQLGTAPSSQRFKDAIKPMDKASEVILGLKPVTFHYKQEIDPDNTPQFGLVAEQVEKVNPDLVARDEEGKVYTVRYEAVNAMLLNEFLKEHRQVEDLKATVAKQEAANDRQENEIKALTASVKEQAAAIQKVNARVEASKPAPQVVANDQ